MLGGCPFAEKIHKIILDLDDIIYLDFFISDLIKPVWIKIASKALLEKEWMITHVLDVTACNMYLLCEKPFTHPEEQSWCLLAGTCRWRGPSHQGGSSHSGWRGGRSTSSFRHHPGQNLSSTCLVTRWQHCDWTLQGIAKSVQGKSLSVIPFSFMSSWLEFLDARNLFFI